MKDLRGRVDAVMGRYRFGGLEIPLGATHPNRLNPRWAKISDARKTEVMSTTKDPTAAPLRTSAIDLGNTSGGSSGIAPAHSGVGLQASSDPAPESPQWLAARLEQLLGGEISGLSRLSGGASRQTWAFDFAPAGGSPQQLILRRDPPTATRVGGMPLEAALFAAAAQAGVPVPQLVANGDADPNVLGTGFLVMHRVAGETIARKILRDEPYAHARLVAVAQMGAALAKLHRAPIDSVPGLEPLDVLQKYRTVLDELGHSNATFELAFRWLEAHRPAPVANVVVHGDFRLGNVIIDERGLVAVLDWELAHLGDPAEDMGWLCVRAWRFGGKHPVAGLGTYTDLLRAYEEAGGVPIPEERVHWWEVAGTLMWGIMCMLQANAHITGAIRSVELAAIGRRVAEQEHDLLTLLGAPELGQAQGQTVLEVGSESGSTVGSVAGHPSALVLLEAVREYLDTDVRINTSGRTQFHSRVASNVVATLERELALAPALQAANAETLRVLGISELNPHRAETALASAIRAGAYDDNLGRVASALRPTVTLRLAIANPKHFENSSV
jgi:aminoglycoside phosphotransferase (APT) family kinase protein